MNTNVKVLFYTFSDKELKVLSVSPDVLEVPLFSLDSIDSSKSIAGMQHILKKIHTTYSTISFDWATYKLLELDLHQDLSNNLYLDIYYCVFLPQNTPLSRGHWLDVNNVLAQYPILKKMLYYV